MLQPRALGVRLSRETTASVPSSIPERLGPGSRPRWWLVLAPLRFALIEGGEQRVVVDSFGLPAKKVRAAVASCSGCDSALTSSPTRCRSCSVDADSFVLRGRACACPRSVLRTEISPHAHVAVAAPRRDLNFARSRTHRSTATACRAALAGSSVPCSPRSRWMAILDREPSPLPYPGRSPCVPRQSARRASCASSMLIITAAVSSSHLCSLYTPRATLTQARLRRPLRSPGVRTSSIGFRAELGTT